MTTKHLLAQPEGLFPTTASEFDLHKSKRRPCFWPHFHEVKKCNKFVEVTGENGDVMLFHPLMLKSPPYSHWQCYCDPPVALKL